MNRCLGEGPVMRESVEVVYDPTKVTYQALLDAFWHNVDPGDAKRAVCDHGSQYRAVIFCWRRRTEAPGRGVEARSNTHRDCPSRS